MEENKTLFLKRLSIKDLALIIVFLIFCWQIFMLGYINLTQMKYHIGYDSSSFYLKAVQMWEQKTLFVKNWAEQTNLYLDTTAPLAALFYGITGNIFFSYGLANFLCDIAIVGVAYSILKKLKASKMASLTCLNLIICPYFAYTFNNANDIGYASSILTAGNWYGVRMLVILLVIKIVMDFEDKKDNIPYIVCATVLSFLCGLSSGYYILATVLVPVFVFFIIKLFIRNDIKVLFTKSIGFAIFESIVVVAGKIVAGKVLEFSSIDSRMVLVGLSDFWKNIGSIFLGMIKLLGGLEFSSSIQILAKEGISYIFGLCIFVVCITAVVYFIMTALKDYDKKVGWALISTVAFFNIVMFIVVYTSYAESIFEVRYLCAIFIMFSFMVAYFIDSLDDRLILKGCGLAILIVSIAGKSYSGYKYFNASKIDYDVMNALVESVHEEEGPVYIWSAPFGIDARNLRVIDLERKYKYLATASTAHRWGDYIYYEENSEWEGATVLLSTQEEFAALPVYLQNIYIWKEKIGNFDIYTSEINKFDLVSGIFSEDRNIDFPYSSGVWNANGEFDENGAYVTNGTEGMAIWGPYANTEEGTYNFTLNYEVVSSDSEEVGYFDIYVNSKTVMGKEAIKSGENSVMIENVTFSNDEDRFEYRCNMNAGAIVKIKSIYIERIE